MMVDVRPCGVLLWSRHVGEPFKERTRERKRVPKVFYTGLEGGE